MREFTDSLYQFGLVSYNHGRYSYVSQCTAQISHELTTCSHPSGTVVLTPTWPTAMDNDTMLSPEVLKEMFSETLEPQTWAYIKTAMP